MKKLFMILASSFLMFPAFAESNRASDYEKAYKYIQAFSLHKLTIEDSCNWETYNYTNRRGKEVKSVQCVFSVDNLKSAKKVKNRSSSIEITTYKYSPNCTNVNLPKTSMRTDINGPGTSQFVHFSIAVLQDEKKVALRWGDPNSYDHPWYYYDRNTHEDKYLTEEEAVLSIAKESLKAWIEQIENLPGEDRFCFLNYERKEYRIKKM